MIFFSRSTVGFPFMEAIVLREVMVLSGDLVASNAQCTDLSGLRVYATAIPNHHVSRQR